MKVGPYEVRSELSRSPRLVVARAAAVTGGEVLLTVVRADAARFALFEAERRVLEALTTADGFVPLLDAGTSEAGVYLVQPFLHGGTFAEAVARGDLGKDELVRLVRGAASALARAHDRGLTHGGLSPASIFISDGQPFIADLALARCFPSGERTAWQAPELAAGGAPTARSDVFALGAILREALGGDSPRRDVLQAIERACLADPARRFEDARGFLRALGGGAAPVLHAPTRVDEDELPPPPAPAPTPHAPPSAEKAPGSRTALLAVALVLLVAGLAALLVLLELRHRALEDAERRFFEVALKEGHDPQAALRAADALPEALRAKPQVRSAVAALRSEVVAAESRAAVVAALSRLNDATPAKARLEAAERALAQDPRSARALVERARARLVLGRGAAAELDAARVLALEDLERAATLEPLLVAAHFELGRVFWARKDGRARARAELEKARDLDKGGVLGQVAAARVLVMDRKLDEALAALGAAAERDRDATLPLLERARLRLILDRDVKGALEDATRAFELAPDAAPALVLVARARARLAGDNRREPLPDLDRACELDPLCAEAFAIRSLYRHRANDTTRAVEDSNHAADLDTEEPWGYLAQAELLALGANSSTEVVADRAHVLDARTRVAEALARDPDNVEGLMVETALALNLLDHAGALAATERGIALQPKNAAFLANNAIALANLGRRKEALAAFDHAIELRPDADGIRFLRAKFKLEQPNADYDSVVEDLTRALESRHVPPAEALFYRGVAQHNRGRFKEAIGDYDQSERLAPAASWVPRLRAFREDARVRLAGGGR